jgi:hypothetical protein
MAWNASSAACRFSTAKRLKRSVHHRHHGLDQRARREVLASAALHLGCVALQQAFVDGALGIANPATSGVGVALDLGDTDGLGAHGATLDAHR